MQLPGTVDHIGKVRVIELEGEYDLSTAPALAAGLRAASAGSEVVLVDLTRVDFLDSTALQVLFEASAEHRSAGTFAVVAPERSWAGRLIELTGFRNAAPVYADRRSAVAAVLQG